jgi:hypothetical protein
VDSTPQEPVCPIPPPVFPFSRYFHPILDLLVPCIDLKFLWYIIFIHVLDHLLAISLEIIEGFNQIHNLGLACRNWIVRFW